MHDWRPFASPRMRYGSDTRLWYEERAAIREFDGGERRAQAELHAFEEVLHLPPFVPPPIPKVWTQGKLI